MKSLSIYLADLTHDSVGLATEVFPLNIGFIAAYCKKVFGDTVEIKLFKYISDLESEIYKNPPDVLALSNYPWCHNIDLAMLRLLESKRPDAMRIMGGPNFPHLASMQEEFLIKRPIIDAYVYLEGELPFTNLIQFIFETGDLGKARDRLKAGAEVTGIAHLDNNGKMITAPKPLRMEKLDDVPSPYLTGLMDKFFDGRLSPMIQTNRGCPFTCSYCADGTRLVSKIYHFDLERVKNEISYIAERVPKNIKALFLSDLNYGMYARDAEISAHTALMRQKYDYPHYFEATTGKNSRDKIIKNVEILQGTMQMAMSIQSMSPVVLKNIHRENMRLDEFLGLKPAIRKAGLPTASEVILALPGETKESHINGLSQLLDAEIDNIFAWTLMLLNGSELHTPAQKALWNYKTKFRVIPRDFTRLRSGEKVVEVEEVIIETNTLPFEDYVYCRKLILLLVSSNNFGFRPLMRFIVENKLHLMDTLVKMMEILDAPTSADFGIKVPPKLRFFFKEFERETREELWDSEEEIIEYFQSDENFQELLEGNMGANLLQTYKARVWSHQFEELAEFCFAVLRKQIAEKNITVDQELLQEIESFCKARTFNLLGQTRKTTNPEFELNWDIMAWIDDPGARSISHFKLPQPKRCRFELTEKQFEIVEHSLDQFGHNDLGRGKVLIRISPNVLWRNPTEISPVRGIPEFYSVPEAVKIRN